MQDRMWKRSEHCGFVSSIPLLVARPASRSWVLGDGRQVHTFTEEALPDTARMYVEILP